MNVRRTKASCRRRRQIYYDFNGPIDNIYASLVARLVISKRFGPVRLWARYAEFGDSSRGTFGLRRADSIGRGHLDLYFDTSTDSGLRTLFRDFVNDHLTSEGVKVLSGLAFQCKNCGNEFSEPDIRYRLATNAKIFDASAARHPIPCSPPRSADP